MRCAREHKSGRLVPEVRPGANTPGVFCSRAAHVRGARPRSLGLVGDTRLCALVAAGILTYGKNSKEKTVPLLYRYGPDNATRLCRKNRRQVSCAGAILACYALEVAPTHGVRFAETFKRGTDRSPIPTSHDTDSRGKSPFLICMI